MFFAGWVVVRQCPDLSELWRSQVLAHEKIVEEGRSRDLGVSLFHCHVESLVEIGVFGGDVVGGDTWVARCS